MITDFNVAQGDRIRLAAGMGYSVSANGVGDAVITFSSGNDVTLAGVRSEQVSTPWFVAV